MGGLWQFLFEEGVDLEDVRTLLTLCDTHALEFPTLPEIVVRGLSPEILETLCEDSCVIVSIAARNLHTFLLEGGKDEATVADRAAASWSVSAKEESTSSDSDMFDLFA